MNEQIAIIRPELFKSHIAWIKAVDKYIKKNSKQQKKLEK